VKPVVSGGGAGVGVLLGPTGGYLFGFLLAAILIGALVHRSIEPRRPSTVSPTRTAIALSAGRALIYAAAAPWPGYSLGWSITHTILGGALVFVPGDVVKIAAAIALIRGGGLDAIAE
jgi:biotin transport system substrate-specific component